MNTIGLAHYAIYTDAHGVKWKVPAPFDMAGVEAEAWHRLLKLREQHRAYEIAFGRIVRDAALKAGSSAFLVQHAIRYADELVNDYDNRITGKFIDGVDMER